MSDLNLSLNVDLSGLQESFRIIVRDWSQTAFTMRAQLEQAFVAAQIDKILGSKLTNLGEQGAQIAADLKNMFNQAFESLGPTATTRDAIQRVTQQLKEQTDLQNVLLQISKDKSTIDSQDYRMAVERTKVAAQELELMQGLNQSAAMAARNYQMIQKPFAEQAAISPFAGFSMLFGATAAVDAFARAMEGMSGATADANQQVTIIRRTAQDAIFSFMAARDVIRSFNIQMSATAALAVSGVAGALIGIIGMLGDIAINANKAAGAQAKANKEFEKFQKEVAEGKIEVEGSDQMEKLGEQITQRRDKIADLEQKLNESLSGGFAQAKTGLNLNTDAIKQQIEQEKKDLEPLVKKRDELLDMQYKAVEMLKNPKLIPLMTPAQLEMARRGLEESRLTMIPDTDKYKQNIELTKRANEELERRQQLTRPEKTISPEKQAKDELGELRKEAEVTELQYKNGEVTFAQFEERLKSIASSMKETKAKTVDVNYEVERITNTIKTYKEEATRVQLTNISDQFQELRTQVSEGSITTTEATRKIQSLVTELQELKVDSPQTAKSVTTLVGELKSFSMTLAEEDMRTAIRRLEDLLKLGKITPEQAVQGLEKIRQQALMLSKEPGKQGTAYLNLAAETQTEIDRLTKTSKEKTHDFVQDVQSSFQNATRSMFSFWVNEWERSLGKSRNAFTVFVGSLIANLADASSKLLIDQIFSGFKGAASKAGSVVKTAQTLSKGETTALLTSIGQLGLQMAAKGFSSGSEGLNSSKALTPGGSSASTAKSGVNAGTVISDILTLASLVIPFLAEGGVVKKPTLAVIGEKGPEAVVPLSKSFGVDALSKLSGSMNVSLAPGVKISGQDMFVYLERLDEHQNRRFL